MSKYGPKRVVNLLTQKKNWTKASLNGPNLPFPLSKYNKKMAKIGRK